MKLKIEYVDIDSIKPYKNNAKQHPKEQIEQIKKSIEQFGMDDPIGIWKDEIVEGHGRLIACKELGYTEVPIIRLDHLTDEERKAYTLVHNKLTMNSDFDLDILQEELDNFDTIDMSDFGFDVDLDIEEENPKIAVEVLIGHGVCHIITETSVDFYRGEIEKIVKRIVNDKIKVDLVVVDQDKHLAENQSEEVRCGDNGIFKGVPLTDNEKIISSIAKCIYERYEYDGKYILTDDKFICCQSNAKSEELERYLKEIFIDRKVIVNPLGEWTGGTDVDTGATNRKLGSDMAQSVTGGGLHGKDLSKADVSVNIYAFLKAQETGKVVELCCAIGDDTIDGKPYSEIVEIAGKYIKDIGGFEKFAEWGLF